MSLLFRILADLVEISLHVDHFLGEIQVILPLVARLRLNSVDLSIEPFDISGVSSYLHGLSLDDMLHLFKKLSCFNFECREFLLTFFSGLGRQEYRLLLLLIGKRLITGLGQALSNVLIQTFQVVLDLCLLIFGSISSKLSILEPICKYIDFLFDLGSDIFLKVLNLISYRICHSSDSLAQNCALTFNTIDLLRQVCRVAIIIGVLRRRRPILTLLAPLILLWRL